MKKHVLVVEDDLHIRLGVVDALISENYEVSETGDGREVLPLVKQREPDLIILDVMLPGQNGFDVCRELRGNGNRIPILMLTAKGQEVDKVVGLELGADDYMTKPFGIRELLARVHALLRRATGDPTKGTASMPEEIKFGRVTVSTRAMRGEAGKKTFDLSAKELKLLALLFSEAGNVVDRNRILDEVWGVEYYGTTRTLDQVIVKLRQKIEKTPGKPEHLLTVHGVGYRLEI